MLFRSLKRERLGEAIRASAGVLKRDEYPHWATSEDVVAWVRALRAEETTVLPGVLDGLPDAPDA